jgi:hypothetical protein
VNYLKTPLITPDKLITFPSLEPGQIDAPIGNPLVPFGHLYVKGINAGITYVNDDYLTEVNDFTILVNAGTKPITITLGQSTKGRIINIKKVDPSTNPVTVVAVQGTIDGSGSDEISVRYESRTYQFDGLSWWII